MLFSKILFFTLLSFIAGVFISSFFNVPNLLIIEIFLLGIFYFIVFLKNKAVVIFSLCFIALGLGIWRVELAKPYSFEYQEAQEFPLKQKLRDIIYKNFAPPHSNILSALLLGDRSYVSEKWNQKMNITGVRHITAVSGAHIVIIAEILFWLGITIGFYRGQAFYFIIILVWLFIAMIGFQASAVRAAIMGSAFLFCQKIGRQTSSGRILFLTVAIMLGIDPFLLRHNIGFQLSFLATAGLIYLMPVLNERISHLTSKFKPLMDLLSMTISANIFVLPILICSFSYISLVSPITNILIVPISSFLMGFGFLFLLLGFLWQPLGFIAFIFLWPLINYFVLVIDIFSKVSFASIDLRASWALIPVYYSVLVYSLWRYSKKAKKQLI